LYSFRQRVIWRRASLAREAIHHAEDPKPLSTGRHVTDEIHRPFLVGRKAPMFI
jgi:hypothetical protein